MRWPTAAPHRPSRPPPARRPGRSPRLRSTGNHAHPPPLARATGPAGNTGEGGEDTDRLYDAQVRIHATGTPLDQVFPDDMLAGGYRKKYYRALSRLLKDDWPRTLEELEERRRQPDRIRV